jgi:transcriptional regulator with XRE-family HTH domain
MAKRVSIHVKNKPLRRPTFIRQWRESKKMSLEELAERVGKKTGGMTHASLSRIERGLQPYSQPILEAIADVLTSGDVAALLVLDPVESNTIWSMWARANPVERKKIVDIARTIVKTNAG